jgi:hypothetical protein
MGKDRRGSSYPQLDQERVQTAVYKKVETVQISAIDSLTGGDGSATRNIGKAASHWSGGGHSRRQLCVKVTADDSFVSRSRLEPKKDGGHRLVVDLRHVNKHLAEQSCKFETLRDLQHVIRAQDWMISCDLENGYYHVPIHPQHRRYLTTTINGTVVQFNALPFGLSTAPRVFTKFMRPVVAHLRSLGIRMLQYLDDSLFMSQSRESLLEMR